MTKTAPNPDWINAPFAETFWMQGKGTVVVDTPEKRFKTYADYCKGHYIPPFIIVEDTSDPCQP